MVPSVVYASMFAAVLASIKAVSTLVVMFGTPLVYPLDTVLAWVESLERSPVHFQHRV